MVTAGYSGPCRDAQPAPRNADGSCPRERCTVNDPTAAAAASRRACTTPSTRRGSAGFTHYSRCWRTSSWGEHPKGRACDFAAVTNGFGGAATGADRDVRQPAGRVGRQNAEALGIMYVIWYRQIWMPGIGLARVLRAVATRPATHTNHVHISML